jgi:hypothetical protein
MEDFKEENRHELGKRFGEGAFYDTLEEVVDVLRAEAGAAAKRSEIHPCRTDSKAFSGDMGESERVWK